MRNRRAGLRMRGPAAAPWELRWIDPNWVLLLCTPTPTADPRLAEAGLLHWIELPPARWVGCNPAAIRFRIAPRPAQILRFHTAAESLHTGPALRFPARHAWNRARPPLEQSPRPLSWPLHSAASGTCAARGNGQPP